MRLNVEVDALIKDTQRQLERDTQRETERDREAERYLLEADALQFRDAVGAELEVLLVVAVAPASLQIPCVAEPVRKRQRRSPALKKPSKSV